MIPNPSLPRFMDDNRGQILLLAAVAIVLLVFGMVTILNTAAFTEQERATGVDTRGVDTVQYLEQAEYDMEVAIRHANHDPDLNSDADRTNRLIDTGAGDGEFQMIEDRLSQRLGSEGAQVIVHSETATVNTDAVRIWQSGYHNLNTTQQTTGPSPPGGGPPPIVDIPASNYGIINDADNVRSFTIAVTGENVVPPGSGDVFMIDFGSHPNVYVYQDPSDSSRIIVSDTSSSGGQEYAAQASTGDPARISFSHGKLNDRKIPILPGTENIQDVSVENGGNIEAAFDMVAEGVADNDVGFVDNDDNKKVEDGPSTDADELEAHYAVYSVTVEVTINTPESDLTTVVRVTPQLPGYADTGA